MTHPPRPSSRHTGPHRPGGNGGIRRCRSSTPGTSYTFTTSSCHGGRGHSRGCCFTDRSPRPSRHLTPGDCCTRRRSFQAPVRRHRPCRAGGPEGDGGGYDSAETGVLPVCESRWPLRTAFYVLSRLNIGFYVLALGSRLTSHSTPDSPPAPTCHTYTPVDRVVSGPAGSGRESCSCRP